MNTEAPEDFLRIAMHRLDADAEGRGDFFPGPAFAQKVQHRPVARIKAGDVLAGLIRKGVEMKSRYLAQDDVDDETFALVELWLSQFPVNGYTGDTASFHRALGENDRSDVGFRPCLTDR